MKALRPDLVHHLQSLVRLTLRLLKPACSSELDERPLSAGGDHGATPLDKEAGLSQVGQRHLEQLGSACAEGLQKLNHVDAVTLALAGTASFTSSSFSRRLG